MNTVRTASTGTSTSPILSVDQVVKTFVTRRSLLGKPRETLSAVAGVSFDAFPGETVGIVGETGSGKSTLGRVIAHLVEPDSGTVGLDGVVLGHAGAAELREHRSKLQLIFQDPRASLDPQRSVGHAIVEPLKVHRRGTATERRARSRELIRSVGLSERLLDAYPAQLSGGQRQRVAIARALALEPKVIIADEPTSALDLSTRSEVLNLLMDVQDSTGVALILISHDLSVVRHLADQTAVMYLGRFVEIGRGDEIAANPLHPYTMALMSAAPRLSAQTRPARIMLTGDAPNPTEPPAGCSFHPRCPFAVERCRQEVPALKPARSGVLVACHLAGQINPVVRAAV